MTDEPITEPVDADALVMRAIGLGSEALDFAVEAYVRAYNRSGQTEAVALVHHILSTWPPGRLAVLATLAIHRIAWGEDKILPF